VQRTKRLQVIVALRESEKRFRRMADTAPVMVWVSGADKGCTYVNKAWLDFTGRPAESQLGEGWSEGVHAVDLRRCLDTYVWAFDARQAFRMEYRLRRSDGEYRWVLDVGAPRFAPDGAFKGYIGSCIDITEQKQVEEALRESQRELQALAGRLIQAEEAERRRIARELHDDLNQSLALLAVELDLLGQKPPESAAQVGGRMHELCARVKQLSSDVHDLSHNLHPSKLEQLGLVAGVRGLCKEQIEAHHLEVEFAHKQMPPSIPDDTVLCLYRIAQEALGNIIKHSGARHAHVELSGGADGVSLRITDDGAGFDLGSVDGNGGLGLVSMRERLRLVGGAIVIDSRPSAGTRIDVHVPLCPAGQGPNGPPEKAGRAQPAGL
jgi:PAS domain S-box-containing protein